MREGRFTDEQIIAINRRGGSRTGAGARQAPRGQQADDLYVAEALRAEGVTMLADCRLRH
jgi:hypothetical protein